MKKMENKEYANSMRTMRAIIDYYLKGKLETEIAALLSINEKEIKYVLGEENNIIHTFDHCVWNAIERQREYNQMQVNIAFQKDFLYMSDENLRYIMNSFFLTCKNVNQYCKLYQISPTNFLLHILSLDYMVDKMGRKGKSVLEKIQLKLKEIPDTPITNSEEQQELFRLSALYLDSLYTKEEMMEKAKINKEKFEYYFENKENIMNLGNEELYKLLLHHKEWIDNVRKKGNLPHEHYWIKDAKFRRILVQNVFTATPKTIADLHIILAYYEQKGNLDKVQIEQKRNKREMQKIIRSLEQYASIIQPFLLHKILLLREIHMPQSTTMCERHIVINQINYQKEMEQKIEKIDAIKTIGNIRPYWLCGQVAIHNFSFHQASVDLKIDEDEIELAFYCYITELTTTSQGALFPYHFSYEILKYVSTLSTIKEEEGKCQKSKK